jgi:hypothetical protein
VGVFDDIKLSWHGKEYRIPANRVLGAVVRVEDILTLTQLADFVQKGNPPLGKLSQAYGAVLRYAGADVDDDEVFADMFGKGDAQALAVDAVMTLFNLMVPKATLAAAQAGGNPAGNGLPTAARSSKRFTKRRSATAG